MKIKVLVAGATGWAGSALCKGIDADPGLELTGGISRKMQGRNLSQLLELQSENVPVFGDAETALSTVTCDVFFEFTKPEVAKKNIITAIGKGVNVIVGTSGLTDEDYQEIETLATKHKVSVLAVGNFAITAVLLMKFSEMAAKYISDFEVIDYADSHKIDSPSGTTRELVKRLSQVRIPNDFVSGDHLVGPVESRGAKINHVRVHALRLPSYTISVESVFGLQDERLTIRHDSGTGAEPYVKGGLLAIKKVGSFKGFKRGLDSVMD
jgi:4-hydroxy-tetrahydrodipicolinate reductase